jgi:hypothetical protein
MYLMHAILTIEIVFVMFDLLDKMKLVLFSYCCNF